MFQDCLRQAMAGMTEYPEIDSTRFTVRLRLVSDLLLSSPHPLSVFSERLRPWPPPNSPAVRLRSPNKALAIYVVVALKKKVHVARVPWGRSTRASSGRSKSLGGSQSGEWKSTGVVEESM